jgi:starch synthase
MSIDLEMAAGVEGADLVHSHTWYANLAGHLAALTYGIPHVATVHSLEPLRPWKAEQLGGGYALSRFCERTGLEGADAIVAVSAALRRDLLACYPSIDPGRVSVIGNGIDTDEFRPDRGTDALERYGIDPALPSVVFVGRFTRQKGLAYLVEAAGELEPAAQLVLCASAPETPELGREVMPGIERLREAGRNVIWMEEMLPRREVIQIVGNATVFVCPSIYEPLGIVNLEAMACETAVVASRVGGIPEVVEDGVTGLLVPLELRTDGSGEPADPQLFAHELAERIGALLADPARAEELGKAGRAVAIERFGWAGIAERIAALYRGLLGR